MIYIFRVQGTVKSQVQVHIMIFDLLDLMNF